VIIRNAPIPAEYNPTFKVLVDGTPVSENLSVIEACKLCDQQSQPSLVVDQDASDAKFINHANTAYHDQFPVIQERDNYDD
jgi:hypothetical protein